MRISDWSSDVCSSDLDGRHVVLGTRSFGNPRYGLAMLDKHGVREIAGKGSMTRCGLDDDLTLALCVQESMTRPPALVRVHLANGKIAPIAALSPRPEEKIGRANG